MAAAGLVVLSCPLVLALDLAQDEVLAEEFLALPYPSRFTSSSWDQEWVLALEMPPEVFSRQRSHSC